MTPRPNFFIVGTTKGGTSTLHLWLGQHPQIGLSRRKELHYWCECPDANLRVVADMDDYLSRFPDASIVGESSPCYLYYPSVAGRLKSEFPDARILISLRDPVARFWSHYLMNEVYRPTGLGPDEVLEANLRTGFSNALDDLFGMGLYTAQVERFLEAFGPDQVLVTSLEELASDPDKVVSASFSLLGLSATPIDTGVRDKEYVEPRGPIGRLTLRNPSVRRLGVKLIPAGTRRLLRTRVLGDPARKPTLDPELESRLRSLYCEDCRSLERLLGKELPWSWHRGSSV